MFAPSIKVALVIVVTLLALTLSQTTKAPTVICPTQCLFFTGNGNKFTNDADAARNLSRVIFRSSNHIDILNAFPHYSRSFKTQQLQNLLAFQQLRILRGKIINKYGAEAAQAYYHSISSDSACKPYDPSINQGIGQFPAFDMYEDIELPQKIDQFFTYDTLIGIYLAWNDAPRQFLTPDQHMSLDPTSALAQSFCSEQFQHNYFRRYKIYINRTSNADSEEVQPESESDSDRELLSIGDDSVTGFSNMLLNTFYGEELIETYRNCMRQIYTAC